jgi:hypothetical protein
MRALVAMLLAALTAPLLLVACNGDQTSPTPATSPDIAPAMALSANRSVALDPSHTYLFSFACSAAAPNSLVTITTVGNINITCNSWTEIGAANLSPFSTFAYGITLDVPGAKVCSEEVVTTTGTFRCKSRKYSATLTVTDEGVVPTF